MENPVGAQREIGRGTKAFLVLAPLLLVVAVLAIDAAHGLPLAACRAGKPTLDRLLDGGFARAVDEHVEKKSHAMRLVRPYWNALMLAAFLEAPSKLVVGRDRWLFYTGALQEDGEGQTVSPFVTLPGLSGSLPPNIPIAVLVIPSKWRLYEEKLRGPPPPEWRRADPARARRKLAARGFLAPDVLALLADEKRRNPEQLLFPPNDTHLTQYGCVRLVERVLPEILDLDAEAVRARLRALAVAPEHVFYGDLEHLLGLPEESLLAREYSYAGPAYSAPELGDGPADILFVGDSFAVKHNQLFPRLVQQASGLTVDARLVPALAARRFDVVKRILSEYRARPPRIVLAIYAERRF